MTKESKIEIYVRSILEDGYLLKLDELKVLGLLSEKEVKEVSNEIEKKFILQIPKNFNDKQKAVKIDEYLDTLENKQIYFTNEPSLPVDLREVIGNVLLIVIANLEDYQDKLDKKNFASDNIAQKITEKIKGKDVIEESTRFDAQQIAYVLKLLQNRRVFINENTLISEYVAQYLPNGAKKIRQKMSNPNNLTKKQIAYLIEFFEGILTEMKEYEKANYNY